MSNESDRSRLPRPKEILLSEPLYKKFKFTEEEIEEVAELEMYAGPLDAYCMDCHQQTIFSRSVTGYPAYGNSLSPAQGYIRYLEGNKLNITSDRTFSMSLTCARNEDHQIHFYFVVHKHKLIKVGQYPSLADFDSPDTEQYRKVLDKQDYDDLRRAIGLSAHGIGVGAFVYLRRIFENLMEEAHLEAKGQAGWDEDLYDRGRVDEKIQLLKTHLPPAMVEMKALYPILSKGVHTLSEEVCLKHFPPLRIGIELILDQKIEQIRKVEKQKKEERAKQMIAEIKGDLT